jgi:excisionase family DNA binding protein
MSSNIQIQRICEFCGKEFTARTTVTKYCAHACASSAYKSRTRNEKIKISNKKTAQVVSIPIAKIQAKDFLSVDDACKLLGVSRSTLSRAIKDRRLKAVNLGKRIVIKRTEVDRLFS